MSQAPSSTTTTHLQSQNQAAPVVVANACVVDTREEGTVAHLGMDEVIKANGARLLHALQAEAKVHWQLTAHLAVCLQHPQPAQHWALVVGCSTAPQDAVDLLHGEWLRRPAIALCGRLHIQVAVHQQRLLLWVAPNAGENDRRQLVAIKLAYIAQLDLPTTPKSTTRLQ